MVNCCFPIMMLAVGITAARGQESEYERVEATVFQFFDSKGESFGNAFYENGGSRFVYRIGFSKPETDHPKDLPTKTAMGYDGESYWIVVYSDSFKRYRKDSIPTYLAKRSLPELLISDFPQELRKEFGNHRSLLNMIREVMVIEDVRRLLALDGQQLDLQTMLQAAQKSNGWRQLKSPIDNKVGAKGFQKGSDNKFIEIGGPPRAEFDGWWNLLLELDEKNPIAIAEINAECRRVTAFGIIPEFLMPIRFRAIREPIVDFDPTGFSPKKYIASKTREVVFEAAQNNRGKGQKNKE